LKEADKEVVGAVSNMQRNRRANKIKVYKAANVSGFKWHTHWSNDRCARKTMKKSQISINH
jgi:hypothetical protein